MIIRVYVPLDHVVYRSGLLGRCHQLYKWNYLYYDVVTKRSVKLRSTQWVKY